MSSRALPVSLAGLLVLTVVGVAWAVWSAAGARSGPRPDTGTTRVPTLAPRHALRVLHGWDARRAEAWSRGSASDLASLYLRGSDARQADRALLRRYADRGLRVVDLHRQTLAVRVLNASAVRLTVRVTDRVVDAVALGPGGRVPLPHDRPSTVDITFRRLERGWVVASVRPVAG